LISIKPLRFFELMIRPCARVYGSSPCAAAVGVTGDYKCRNSPRTCQDTANYLAGDEQVLRFAEPTSDLPIDVDAIPCITSISRRPQVVDPGESIGTRESVTVTCHNFRRNDAELDPYLDERTYNTYNSGTFWGKFFAWWGNIQGIEARTVDGFVGQDIDEMERRYYVVEDTAGPDSSGNVSITVKDILKLLDGDKAQFPLPSAGILSASITTSSTSLTLEPSGIGSTYPTSGIASMGDESVSFTRSGDVITLTARGIYGSEVDDHDDGETFQIGVEYSGETPAYLINDWMSVTEVPAEYINLTAWELECSTHIQRLYSGRIMKPTPVRTLCNELVQEVGLVFYSDLVNKDIVFRSLRNIVPTLTLNDDLYLAGSIASKKSTDKRVDSVWVYYGQKNPLEQKTDKKNYRTIYAAQSGNPVVALEGAPLSIRDIMSRWITVFNRPAAADLTELVLNRYEMSPRQVSFSLHPTVPVSEGQSISISSRIFEDENGGEAEAFTCQVLQVERKPEKVSVLAEEISIAAQEPDDGIFTIYFDNDAFNLNLRSVFDTIYIPPTSGQEVHFIFSPNVKIGSVNSGFAITAGSWPSSVLVKIYADSTNRIQGKGGNAGYGAGSAGEDGSPALYTRFPIEIIGDIKIYGGGGGGAGAQYPEIGGSSQYGGGGAGYAPGFPGGTIDAGLSGMPWGRAGGNPGSAGTGSGFVAGGAPGVAVDGDSYVTYTGTPVILGAQIN